MTSLFDIKMNQDIKKTCKQDALLHVFYERNHVFCVVVYLNVTRTTPTPLVYHCIRAIRHFVERPVRGRLRRRATCKWSELISDPINCMSINVSMYYKTQN
jgi:hypothetical protein